MVNDLLEPWYQDDTELVVICGRTLLSDKYFPIINKDQAPTEQLAADVVMSQKRIGGLPAVRVPYFPDGKLLITRLDNLSLYWQEGTRRRTVEDNAKRDRIENYESVNDAYVIEDLGCAALAENITLV
ncbi:Phage major capsid protein, P2 family [compost metagenome]